MPRLRPAFFSSDRSWVRVSAAAAAGVGAAARMARASGRVMPPRASAKAARKPGKYSRRWERSLLCAVVRSRDGVLLGAGQHRDGLGQLGIGGQRPVHVHVGAQHVRQHDRVAVVGLLPRDRVPVPVAGHCHRVDRIDRPAGGAQARDQQPARGLDRHRDRIPGGVAVLGEQGQQFREPGRVVADPAAGQQLAVPVHDGDVVVILGPVDPAVNLHRVLLVCSISSRGRYSCRPEGRAGHARSLMEGLEGAAIR